MKDIYYVYQHVRMDTNSVFYVGKGKENRCNSTKNRNKHWRNITEKTEYSVEVVADGLNQELAFLCEIELIDKQKRLGCILANYTSGGEGVSGYKHTEQCKRRMSDKKVGKQPWNKGIAHSEESRRKMSESRRGVIPWNKGIAHSEESRRKMSLAKVGVFKTKKWWTDGIKNTRSENSPGENWYNGRAKK